MVTGLFLGKVNMSGLNPIKGANYLYVGVSESNSSFTPRHFV
jgi:hypothetical protein